jgi:uncharacterized protein
MSAAVAILAKSPDAGRVKTRLTPPLTPDEASRVARVCLEETLRRFVPSAPVPFTLFLDGALDRDLLALTSELGIVVVPQGGGDLSERIGSAFGTMRARGAERTIAIGSDSPTLDPGVIREAIEALDSRDVVLGPAEDGGYYLIGTRGMCDGLLARIPWSTERVMEVTMSRAGALGLAVAMLASWYDVDDPVTLRRAIQDPIRGLPVLRDLLPRI